MKVFPARIAHVMVMLSLMLVACARPAPVPAEATADVGSDAAAPAPPAPMMERAAAASPLPAIAPQSRMEQPAPPQGIDAGQLASAASTYTDGQRRFVRTADARLRVRDTYAAALAIEDLVARQQGFVVSNRINAQILDTQRRSIGHARLLEVAEYTVNGTLTVRVPSEHTQALLRAMAAQIDFLDARSFQADDVQFDLLTQALAEQREEQSQQELGQATARNGRADQVAQVVDARRQARERRDGVVVEQRRMEDRIAFSTLTFSLYQPSMIRRTELPDVEAVLRDNAPSFAWRLGQALQGGWDGVEALALWLATAWPLWLAMMVVVLLARAGLRVLRRNGRGG
jgi:hypothetical protein